MKNLIVIFLLLLVNITCQKTDQKNRSEQLFDDSWKFFLGNI